jgi:hypothetical protein
MKGQLVILLLALSLLVGCGTIFPKRVEFGQDKVEKFPARKPSEEETLRQAALRAKEDAARTLEAALAEQSTSAVIEPATSTARLTDSVSLTLGPPVHRSADPSDELARKLELAVAKLNHRIDNFRADNDQNAGHKIEGTGWLSVPYFVWIGGVAVVGFIGLVVFGVAWSALKMFALSNPPLALGLNAVQLGARGAKSLAGQLLKGGEQFKDRLMREVKDPVLQAQVKDIFRSEHEKAQSPESQALIKHLTS